MLLRLHSKKANEVRIYDLANIAEEDAVTSFVSMTKDENPEGEYFEFQEARSSELAWWVRTGGEVYF